jgi:predicted O-methyltransferase YrrM
MDVALLDQICSSGMIRDAAGAATNVRLTSIDREECKFLSGLIESDESIQRTLEIGCAYGVSSLCICQALQGRPGAHHTILDPLQTSLWKGAGAALLKQAGCDWFELREEGSEVAMPAMLKDHAGGFDLVFIDGVHTFDHTLLDLFYATRLVRVGGYVVVDDAKMMQVSKALAYFVQYPAYRVWGQKSSSSRLRELFRGTLMKLLPPSLAGWFVPRIPYDYLYARHMFTSMVALQKVAPDERPYPWMVSF